MNIKKKNPQEAVREDFNDVEVFLNREDNQFYYLDRYRKPVKLIPETNIITDNTTITGSGTEEDPLVATGGSGASVPEMNLRVTFGLSTEITILKNTTIADLFSGFRGGVGLYDLQWAIGEFSEPQKLQVLISNSSPNFALGIVSTLGASGISFKFVDAANVSPTDTVGTVDIQIKYFGS